MEIRIAKRGKDGATLIGVPARRTGRGPVMALGVQKDGLREAVKTLIAALTSKPE